ncbi:MAG: hypothetical protein WCZ65_00360 [Lysobacteraceae bacterium]
MHPDAVPSLPVLLLRRWLLLGALAVLLLPAARGHSAWVGWLPYWLAVAPALSLALCELHRRRPRARARRRDAGAQARRAPATALPRLSLAALLAGSRLPPV